MKRWSLTAGGLLVMGLGLVVGLGPATESGLEVRPIFRLTPESRMASDNIEQAEETNLGVTLIISPENVPYGGTVALTGATAPDPRTGNRTVTILFTPPSGESFTRTTALDGEMRYSLDFSPVAAVGEWKVEVTGPVSQLGKAEGRFQVDQPAAFVGTSMTGLGEGCLDGAGFSESAEAMTSAFTELPDKDTALEKMGEVLESFNKMGNALSGAAAEMNTINSVMGDLQCFPEVRDAVSGIGGELAGAAAQVEALSQELQHTREEMNNAREHCRRFHFQKYGWNICIDMVQAAFTPGNTLYKFAKDQLTDALKSAANKAADEAVMKRTGLTEEQIAKARQAVAVALKSKEVIKTYLDPKGDFSDLTREGAFAGAKWLVDWIYSKVGKNCRMYQAEIKGTLQVDYYTKDMVYMVARYPISGEMKVFFQKRERGSDIVKLKGQIQGSFGWRTGLFYPERTCMDVPGMSGAGFCVPRPPFVDFLDFVIMVEGEGKPHSIELEFTEATSDIERLPYMFCSVLWSPYQIVPAVDFPKMDVPGAWWFFTRVTATAGDENKFNVPLTVDGDTVKMEHTFNRVMDYIRQREFKATLKWEIKGKEDGI